MSNNRPFKGDNSLSKDINSLVNQCCTWLDLDFDKQSRTISYSFLIQPQHKQSKNHEVDLSLGMQPVLEDQTLVVRAFEMWSSVANIRFRPDANGQLSIFQYTQPREHYQRAVTFPSVLGFACYPHVVAGRKESHIALNACYLRENRPSSVFSNQFKVILHEVGHTLGLKHGFALPLAWSETEPEKNYTSFSIMNYRNETAPDGRFIIPSTPMPVDIEAAQSIYGRNLQTGSGDTIYDLSAFIPAHPQKIISISTIWDASGTDTFDASRIPEFNDIHTININPLKRSIFAAGMIVIANGVDIENVITGESPTTVVLNELDNIVDLRLAAASVLIVNSTACGQDLVFGSMDVLLQDLAGKAGTKIPCNQTGQVLLGNTLVSYIEYSKIVYSPKQSITFANVTSEKIKPGPGFNREDHALLRKMDEPDIYSELFSNFPNFFLSEFMSSFTKGFHAGFIAGLTEDILRHRYHFSDTQINAAMILLPVIVTGYFGSLSGSFLTLAVSTVASSMASSLFSACGFSGKTRTIASLVAGNIAAGTLILSPYGITRAIVSATGTVAGSHLSFWAYGKTLKHFISKEEVTQPQHKQHLV